MTIKGVVTTNLPRLMNVGFSEIGVLHPSKFTPSVELFSLGGAKMSLPEGEPVVGFRQWVQHVLPTGSLIIYRVSSAPLDCGKEQRVSLSHGIVTLEDELTPADTTLTGTPRAILTALLGYQRTVRWQLGSAPDTGQYSLDVNSTKVLRAFWDAVELFTGYAPTYDFTTTPWTVGLAEINTEPACECRLSRNIASVTIDYDDADFCTRVCAPQLPDGHLIADTASIWGEVSRDLGVADDAPADEVLAYAQRFLAKHKNPAIYAEVDGFTIAGQTGEALDFFDIGLTCRCALPDYGITVDEPIISMRYDDLVRKPNNIRLSLGRKIKDTGLKIAKVENDTDSNSKGLRGAGSGLREAQNTLIEQGESLITLAAWSTTVDGAINEANIQIDGLNAAIILKASQTSVDGLTSRLSAAEIDIDGANAAIALKASQSDLDVMGDRLSAAEIDIDGANAAIALKASQSDLDAMGNRVSDAEAELIVQADSISTKVSKNGVISAINQTAESVTIQASKINLDGYVTASQLSASVATLQSAYATSFATENLGAGSCAVSNTLSANGRFTFQLSEVSKTTITVVKSFTPASTESITFLTV